MTGMVGSTRLVWRCRSPRRTVLVRRRTRPGPYNALTNAQGLTFAFFTSATPGKVTGHAVSSLNLGSQQDPIFIQTDGQGQNGSDAVKTLLMRGSTSRRTRRTWSVSRIRSRRMWRRTWVTGWVDAVGVAVQITLGNAAGAAATPAGPFNALTDGNGLTTATFTSNTPGTVTGHAVSSSESGFAAGSGVHPDRWSGPERVGCCEEVREREHPDHAGEREQPGRHEPRADDHRERARRHDRRRPAHARRPRS